MAKTDLGCEILHNKGHLNEFSQFIKKHCDEIEDSDLIQKLKSILWAVVILDLFLFSLALFTPATRAMLDQPMAAFPFWRRRRLYQSFLKLRRHRLCHP